MENQKYEIIRGDIKRFEGSILHRIRALRDFGTVKAGDLGGYVQDLFSLSHEGDCWLGGNAILMNSSFILGDAVVTDNAVISDKSIVKDKARVYGNARVSGNSIISDKAKVYDDAKVMDDSRVFRNAKVYEKAWVSQNSTVTDNAKVSGESDIQGESIVMEKAVVKGSSFVHGKSVVGGKVHLGKSSIINGMVLLGDTTLNYEKEVAKTFSGKYDLHQSYVILEKGDMKVLHGVYKGSYDEFRNLIKDKPESVLAKPLENARERIINLNELGVSVDE